MQAAAGGILHAGHDLQQRALAGAVDADQRQLIAFGDLKGDIAEYQLGAVVFVQRVDILDGLLFFSKRKAAVQSPAPTAESSQSIKLTTF
jgi:hypothetical protein